MFDPKHKKNRLQRKGKKTMTVTQRKPEPEPEPALSDTQAASTDNPVGGGGNKTIWKEVLDKSSGKTYYVNTETNETTWTKPAPPTPQLQPSGQQQAAPMSAPMSAAQADLMLDGLDPEPETAAGEDATMRRTWSKPAEI